MRVEFLISIREKMPRPKKKNLTIPALAYLSEK